MSDIFIAYAREDRDRADLLARLFESQGWSVWWDPRLDPGDVFDEVIEDALTRARCVVVLWSKHSAKSRWVKAEAAEGEARNILVPVLVDQVDIPLAFRRIATADLVGWKGTDGQRETKRLIRSVRRILREDAGAPEVSGEDKGAVEIASPVESAETSPYPTQKSDDPLNQGRAGMRGEAAQSDPTLQLEQPRTNLSPFRRTFLLVLVPAIVLLVLGLFGELTRRRSAPSAPSALDDSVAAGLIELKSYKIDIYYDENSSQDQSAAGRIQRILGDSIVRQIVLAPEPPSFVVRTGLPRGYEVRYDRDTERNAGLALLRTLNRADTTLSITGRSLGNPQAEQTISVFLFSNPGSSTASQDSL